MDKAVLFDMDGVLIDTEGLKARAHAETLARYGGALPPDTYSLWMGRSQHEVQTAFAAAAGVSIPGDEYAEVFGAIYGSILEEGFNTTPGARELLTTLCSAGCRLALVTSSLRWMLERVFEETGFAPLFDAVVTADDVIREKPAPDAYLRALALLGAEPERAVVVEDTEAGVAAGRAAGCEVVAVRHAWNARHDFRAAFAVLPGFADVTASSKAILLAVGR